MSGASGSSGHPELRAGLIAALDERAPRVDRDRVAACFDFVDRAHGPQLRQSGLPFVSHVVEVCRSCQWHHLISTLPIGRGHERGEGSAVR